MRNKKIRVSILLILCFIVIYSNTSLKNDLTSPSIDFEMESSDPGGEIEFHYVDVRTWSLSHYELYLLASLEGMFNNETDHLLVIYHDGMEQYMLDLNNTGYNATDIEISSLEYLIGNYSHTFDGIIIWDDLPESANIGTPLVKINNSLLVHEDLYDSVKTWAGFGGKPITVNLTQEYESQGFTSETNIGEIYAWAFDKYYGDCSTEALGMISSSYNSNIRSQLCAEGIFTFWQPMYCTGQEADPRDDEADLAVFEDIIANSPSNIVVYGYMRPYGCNEHPVVSRLSTYGKYLIPSDHFANMPFWSSLPLPDGYEFNQSDSRDLDGLQLENKLYVAGIYSDGDNLQFVQNFMKSNLWDGKHGSVPTTYEMTPSIYNIAPTLAMLYYEQMTDDDYFVNGVGGKGYVKSHYATEDYFTEFWEDTRDLMLKLDQRELRTWDSGDTSSIIEIMDDGLESRQVDSIIEGYFGGVGYKPHSVDGVPFMRMRLFSASNETEYADEKLMLNTILESIGNQPEFLTLHLNCWGCPYDVWEDFVNTMVSESGGDIVFVTSGQLSQLMLQANIGDPNQIYFIITIIAAVGLCILTLSLIVIPEIKRANRNNNSEIDYNEIKEKRDNLGEKLHKLMNIVRESLLLLTVLGGVTYLFIDEGALQSGASYLYTNPIVHYLYYEYEFLLYSFVSMIIAVVFYSLIRIKIKEKSHEKKFFITFVSALGTAGMTIPLFYANLGIAAIMMISASIILIGIFVFYLLTEIGKWFISLIT